MKPWILFLVILSSLYMNMYSQQQHSYNSSIFFNDDVLNNITVLVIPAPVLIIEDKRVYFGLSKEVSLGFGKYAEHRLAFEYTYVFRDTINGHYRLSYNYDLFPNSILNITAGAGYFTDTHKKGLFPQLSINAIGSGGNIYFMLYIRSRVTFALKNEDTGLFDMSAGIAIGLAPFGSKVRKGFDL